MTKENNKDVPLKNENEESIYLKKIGERLKYFRKKAGFIKN